MTNEEAIKRLNGAIVRAEYTDDIFADSVDIEALKMAIEALEKQMPKKPELISIDENTKYTWKCPTCGSYEIFNFCQHCGQRINWEKEPSGKEEEQ